MGILAGLCLVSCECANRRHAIAVIGSKSTSDVVFTEGEALSGIDCKGDFMVFSSQRLGCFEKVIDLDDVRDASP